MKYFVCLILFLLLCLAVWLWQRAKRKLKHTLLKIFLSRHYDCKQTNTPFCLFADDIFEMVAYAVLKADAKTRNQIFKKLKEGNGRPLFTYIKTKEKPLYQLLTALCDNKQFIKNKISTPQTPVSKLALALAGESQFEYEKLGSLLSTMPVFWESKNLRRLKKLLNARRLFFKTDLKRTAEILTKLAAAYQKDNDAFRTAYAYLMLGQTYRLAKAFDIAELMFEKSLRIYKHLSHNYGQNLIFTELGLNCLEQCRFDEAHTYLKKARLFYAKQKNMPLEANLLNLQSCCHLGQNNFELAKHTTNKALKLHKHLGSRNGMAFSLKIKAAALLGTHNHKMAETYAKSALKHYQSLQNRPAELEMLCLLTKIHIDACQTQKAKGAFKTFCNRQKKYNLPFKEDAIHIKEMLDFKKTLK